MVKAMVLMVKTLDLMVKAMVSGEDFPNETHPLMVEAMAITKSFADANDIDLGGLGGISLVDPRRP